jgi:hypothetical protein
MRCVSRSALGSSFAFSIARLQIGKRGATGHRPPG